MSDEVMRVARSLLKVSSKCWGHCGEMATVEFIEGGDMAAQACPSGYVSRIIAYGKEADPIKLREFVQRVAGRLGAVELQDVRVASRYAWDLGLERKNNDLILRETYWTQNYRRTKSEDPARLALFLCSNKDALFVDSLATDQRFCERCRE